MEKIQKIFSVFLLLSGMYLVNTTKAESTWPVGINLGLGVLFPNQVTLDVPPAFNIKTQLAWLAKAEVEIAVVDSLSFSSAILFSHVNLPEFSDVVRSLPSEYRNQLPTSITAMQAGVGPKFSFEAFPDVVVQFAVYMGFRNITSEAEIAKSIGFALDGAMQVHFPLNQQMTQFVELGFLNQPYGGKQDYYYLTFGPIIYLMAGVGF